LLAREWPQEISEVDAVFISPAASAKVHLEFFQDPAATDIMTFEHGELLICPAIAEKQRRDSGLSFHDELLTYIIHGLLHLCGWTDLTTTD
jgi:probable rRNA maturation factor